MKRRFLKAQRYTFNTTRTKLCHKYIHMLSVCGYAYFYSRKNMWFYAERLTIQKITFVDETIWNSFSSPSSLPPYPLFRTSSLSQHDFTVVSPQIEIFRLSCIQD